jgi:hypothetical protein
LEAAANKVEAATVPAQLRAEGSSDNLEIGVCQRDRVGAVGTTSRIPLQESNWNKDESPEPDDEFVGLAGREIWMHILAKRLHREDTSTGSVLEKKASAD